MAQKSVLITGCSAGSIGSSLATSFANRGFLVFATARNTAKISTTLSNLSNVEVVALDTTSQASIAAAVEAVSKRTGGTLDYLVNNAGSGLASPFLDTNLEDARKVFEVNFWGVVMCIQGFQKLLVKSRGTIVNISSIAAVAPNPYESIYNASKAAVTQFSETLRHELKPLGVTVTTIMAGMVQSSWYSNSMPQIKLPEDSYYHSVQDAINAGMTGEDNKKNGMNVDTFAELVVKDVIGGRKGLVWRGALSALIYWVSWLAPTWVLDGVMYDRAGLKELENERRKL